MTAKAILEEIKPLGRESYKKVLLNHGAQEPCFGVKIEDLKKIQKRIKKDHELALKLYDTGISDAMYLAALIAEPARMKKADLQRWAKKSTWGMLSEYTVAWVAAESRFGAELARERCDLVEEEIGDLLFSVVNLARLAGVHPSTALVRANRKFERRFRRLEELACERGIEMASAGLPALDALWDEAKRGER